MTPVLATQILRDDHKRLTGLFRQLEAIDQGRSHEMKRGVIAEIFMEIEIHSAVEEQLFYPALLAALGNKPNAKTLLDPAVIDQGLRDHREIEEVIQRLRQIPMDTLDFHDQLDELEQLFEGHIEEEEQLVFAAAEELLGDELSPLGAQLQDVRDDLLRQPQYRSALAEVVQNPNGGEQMRTTSGSNVA